MNQNFNQEVVITLTEKGIEMLKQRHKDLQQKIPNYNVKFEDIYKIKDMQIKMQLWQVMNIFGSKMNIGEELPMKTEYEYANNSKQDLEIRLYFFIKELYQEIKDMHPKDGLISPRDIELTSEINKKAAILDCLQEGMKIYNPLFDIRKA